MLPSSFLTPIRVCISRLKLIYAEIWILFCMLPSYFLTLIRVCISCLKLIYAEILILFCIKSFKNLYLKSITNLGWNVLFHYWTKLTANTNIKRFTSWSVIILLYSSKNIRHLLKWDFVIQPSCCCFSLHHHMVLVIVDVTVFVFVVDNNYFRPYKCFKIDVLQPIQILFLRFGGRIGTGNQPIANYY